MIRETPEGVGHPEFQGPTADGEGTAPSPQDHEPGTDGSYDAAPDDGSRIPKNSELEDLAVEAERLVRDGIDQAERRIRRHPIASVGIAAGVGLLLGVLLGRDR